MSNFLNKFYKNNRLKILAVLAVLILLFFGWQTFKTFGGYAAYESTYKRCHNGNVYLFDGATDNPTDLIEDCHTDRTSCDKDGDQDNTYCDGEIVRGEFDHDDYWCEAAQCRSEANVDNNECDCMIEDCNDRDDCVNNDCEYCSGGDRWIGDKDIDYSCSGGACFSNINIHGCNQTEIGTCGANGCQDNGNGCDSTCVPDASFACDGSGCNGSSCNGSWVTYQPTSNVDPCAYKLENNSTDPDGNSDIVESRWYIKEQGGSYSLLDTCSGICNRTLVTSQTPGNYDLKLEVEDNFGAVDSTTHPLEIKREIETDFECSLDPDTNWKNCNDIDPTVDETLFLRDDSTPSEDASSITSYQWEKDGESIGTNSTTSITIDSTTLNIELTTEDNDGRADSKNYTINSAPPLPDWEETTP